MSSRAFRRATISRRSFLKTSALTAGALISEQQRAVAAGMDDFVSKPFEARSMVRTILRRVHKANGRLIPSFWSTGRAAR